MSDGSGPQSAAPPPPHVTAEVFAADAFRVTLGAAADAALSDPGQTVPGDRYRLSPGARPETLALALGAGPPRLAAGGSIAAAGMTLRLEAEHRLVAEDGETVTILALRLAGGPVLLLPLSPLARATEYVLIGSRPATGRVPLPARVTAAFTLGTAILLADGTPKPVEHLAPGDRVLTRDNGPRPLRARLHARLRAAGDGAPVVFAPGSIGNAAELAVSPYHRILLYRPGTDPGTETTERFVQARHLGDGAHVRRREGGHADYFALVFDNHEVIYAEGFPCESLCVTPAATSRLPRAMAADLARFLPGRDHAPRPTPESPRADLGPFRGA